MIALVSLLSLAALSVNAAVPKYTATYTLSQGLPNHSEAGQYGTDNCGTGSSPTSMCQVAILNSIEDFCVWGPPYSNGKNATIGETERIEVAYCLKDGYGTRLIPDGTIIGAHWVQTPDYVQITGNGDWTKIGIPHGDAGGELDPHGADGNGNPIGGLVFGNSFGKWQQYHEWTSFMSWNEFCFRACKDGPNAPHLCNHIYDTLGCQWNMPADYSNGAFDSCLGDTGLPMGIYGTSTFRQGQPATPGPHPKPATSSCTKTASLTQIAAVASPTSAGGPVVTVFTSGTVVETSTIVPTTTAVASAAATTVASKSGASLTSSASWFGIAAAVVGAFVAL